MNDHLDPKKIKASPVIIIGTLIAVIAFIVVAGIILFSTNDEGDTQNTNSTSSQSATVPKDELDYDIDELDAMTTSISPSDFSDSDFTDSSLGI